MDENDRSLTISNEGRFVVTIAGEVSNEVDAFAEITEFEISEETFYDSNVFVEISGPAFISGFASTNGAYSCSEPDSTCEEVFDLDGDFDASNFELSLNPGGSVTFNLTATAFAVFETPSLLLLDAGKDSVPDVNDNCLAESNVNWFSVLLFE